MINSSNKFTSSPLKHGNLTLLHLKGIQHTGLLHNRTRHLVWSSGVVQGSCGITAFYHCFLTLCHCFLQYFLLPHCIKQDAQCICHTYIYAINQHENNYNSFKLQKNGKYMWKKAKRHIAHKVLPLPHCKF